MNRKHFDALLLVSFGGPERREDVLPFLDRVLEGKQVPAERKLAVAEHYYRFGGVSPLNEQNRRLLAALRQECAARNIALPWYWGNRCWHPLIETTLRQMAAEGVEHALAVFTSPYSSYSGCRQYRESIAAAQRAIGDGAPDVSKVRAYFNHPGFVETWQARAGEMLASLPADHRQSAHWLFTAHSIPTEMADRSAYVAQLTDVARLVAERMGVAPDRWQLVYQSRSGPPSQPWLEPDVCDEIARLGARGDVSDVVVLPIGFLSDHLEVKYDLDTEARAAAEACGLRFHRVATPGCHPRFVRLLCELLEERLSESPQRPVVGALGPVPDTCPPDCCPAPRRRRAE